MKGAASKRFGLILLLLLICLPLFGGLFAPAHSQSGSYDLRQNVIAGGGNTSLGNGNLQISGTVGQPAAGVQMSGGSLTQSGGFWHAIQGPASGPSVVFNAVSYTVNEGSPRVEVILNRSGNTSSAATARFITYDAGGSLPCNKFTGVASARCDYEVTIRTVRFADGEISRIVSVPIIDDSYYDGNEVFNLSVSDQAGMQATATVTIIDNDNADGPNPIDTSGFFVRQHYFDFLNREPDASGFNFWTGGLASCGNDLQCLDVGRVNVSAAFHLSIEFQQTGYLVERLYRVAYGSRVGTSTLGGSHQLPVPIVRLDEFLQDTQEIGDGLIVNSPGWETVLANNKQSFVAGFVQRSRFAAAYPAAMTPAQFVDGLNTNAGGVLSQFERDQLGNELGLGLKTRAQVLRAVAENQNLYNTEFNRAFVLMQYFGYLRRNPDDPPDTDYTGYDFWLTKLNQFNGNYLNAEMIKAFISSIEYRSRFGRP
jgi:hypothetical protein